MSSVEAIIVKDQTATELADAIETALAAGEQGLVMRPTHWRKMRRFVQLRHELTQRGVSWIEVKTMDTVQLWCWNPDNLRTVPVFASFGDDGFPAPAGEALETWTLHRHEGRTVGVTEAVAPV